MADLKDYGIDLVTLQSMYDQWCAGAKKSHLERTYLSEPESHGKVFSSLVREHLGVETEVRSPLAAENARLGDENARLRERLARAGIAPGEEGMES
jgi:hypothetical protein